ncbi:hypothetical protein Hanom_Chr10g00939871 [Helianthus anomalus]
MNVSSTGPVLENLNEHFTGCKSSRDEAPGPTSGPDITFTRSHPFGDSENMEIEMGVSSSKGDRKKAVVFTGMDLGSVLGSDRSLEGDGDQISFVSPSWFGSEVMSVFRYVNVFIDNMETDLIMANEKFVSD